MVAVYARSSTTERQPDRFQRVGCRLEFPFKDPQHSVWTCKKFKSIKVNERQDYVQKFRLCFNCLRIVHLSTDCKGRTCSLPSRGKRYNRLLHCEPLKKNTTKIVSDATTAVATNINQQGLPLMQIKLKDLSLNVLAMCDSGFSISFLDKAAVSKLLEKSRSLTTVHFCEHEKPKFSV